MDKLLDHPTHLGGAGYLHKIVGETDNIGFFAIGRARAIPAQATEVGTNGVSYVRCDSGAWGIYGFHTWDADSGTCDCGRTDEPEPVMGHHTLRMEALRYVQVVVDVAPHGYIAYMETFERETEVEACRMRHSDCAPTLQELLRLMIEWDAAYTHFDSREPVAVACHEMLAAMDVPADVHSWLTDSVPEQKVELFLAGEPDAQDRRPGVPDMSDGFNTWITKLILESKPLGGRRV